jgi:2'-5' RNA ligase
VLAVRITPEEEFLGLARSVEAAVVAAGFEPEARRFRAHITLARFRRSGRGQLEPAGEVAALRVDVCDVVLYQSILGRMGARYCELGRVALAPSGTREAAKSPGSAGEGR